MQRARAQPGHSRSQARSEGSLYDILDVRLPDLVFHRLECVLLRWTLRLDLREVKEGCADVQDHLEPVQAERRDFLVDHVVRLEVGAGFLQAQSAVLAEGVCPELLRGVLGHDGLSGKARHEDQLALAVELFDRPERMLVRNVVAVERLEELCRLEDQQLLLEGISSSARLPPCRRCMQARSTRRSV